MSEQKIDYMSILQLAIQEAKKDIYLPEYQKQTSDLECLGVMVSKLSKWDSGNLQQVFDSACEDSNFHHARIDFDGGS